jgi:hypothetical protein
MQLVDNIKTDLGEYDCVMWIVLIWLRIRISGGLLAASRKSSASLIKIKVIFMCLLSANFLFYVYFNQTLVKMGTSHI